ncbi:MAG: hypothetical protein FJ387_20870 [Verrucomicrobia bacterium]|nr:hypothetical protein [Verrucomicrobiota bacterium]
MRPNQIYAGLATLALAAVLWWLWPRPVRETNPTEAQPTQPTLATPGAAPPQPGLPDHAAALTNRPPPTTATSAAPAQLKTYDPNAEVTAFSLDPEAAEALRQKDIAYERENRINDDIRERWEKLRSLSQALRHGLTPLEVTNLLGSPSACLLSGTQAEAPDTKVRTTFDQMLYGPGHATLVYTPFAQYVDINHTSRASRKAWPYGQLVLNFDHAQRLAGWGWQ